MKSREAIILKNIFSYMENSGALDPDDEIDLAALELKYTPRINQSLEEFSNRWNNHPLSSCHKKGPLQLKEMVKLSHSRTETKPFQVFKQKRSRLHRIHDLWQHQRHLWVSFE